MAWLLQTAGIKTVTLQGGYKTFRQWALDMFEQPYQLKVLGGLTGCGKTGILHALRQIGEQVIDLEGLANHRGSAFGNLGMASQPSSEQFQNELAWQLRSFDKTKPIWIEDESSLVGTCSIPKPFYQQISEGKLYLIQRPLEARIDILKQEYSQIGMTDLIQATQRISKRLGGARTQEVINHLQSHNLQQAAELILQYYDKAYTHSITRRNRPQIHFDAGFLPSEACAKQLLK
jgi:tRNA 2-selenouridine synthase